MINQSKIGCDLIPAAMTHQGARLPDDPACDTWRKGWRAAIAEADVRDVVVLSGLQLLGDHDVNGRVVAPRTEQGGELISASLDQIERESRAGGARRTLVVSQVCRRVDPSRLDPRFAFFAGPASDDAVVAWSNDVARRWTQAGPDRVYLDVWEPLCGKGFAPSVNAVPLFHDTVHFSPSGAAMVWTWLVPRIVSSGS